jgi:hypothetical protein
MGVARHRRSAPPSPPGGSAETTYGTFQACGGNRYFRGPRVVGANIASVLENSINVVRASEYRPGGCRAPPFNGANMPVPRWSSVQYVT